MIEEKFEFFGFDRLGQLARIEKLSDFPRAGRRLLFGCGHNGASWPILFFVLPGKTAPRCGKIEFILRPLRLAGDYPRNVIDAA